MRRRIQDLGPGEGRRSRLMRCGTKGNDASPSHDFAADSSSPSDACKRFLSTTELLEETLLHLPLYKIIMAKRISKRFVAVVEGSVKIQRAIFFTPGADRMPTFSFVGTENQEHMKKIRHGMIVNMVLKTTPGLVRSTSSLNLIKALDAGTAWRHYLVSAPACSHIRYVAAVDGEMHTVYNAQGVTMGDVYDAVKQHMPVLDRTRTLGPMKADTSPRQLPQRATGWEVVWLLQGILDSTF